MNLPNIFPSAFGPFKGISLNSIFFSCVGLPGFVVEA